MWAGAAAQCHVEQVVRLLRNFDESERENKREYHNIEGFFVSVGLDQGLVIERRFVIALSCSSSVVCWCKDMSILPATCARNIAVHGLCIVDIFVAQQDCLLSGTLPDNIFS